MIVTSRSRDPTCSRVPDTLPPRTLTPNAIQHLSVQDTSAFSAVTVFRGTKRTIVHNDMHSHQRQANDICHEAVHGLLMHPATPAIDARGCRIWNEDLENEAKWLAGVLLVPEQAAVRIVRLGSHWKTLRNSTESASNSCAGAST
ncbi:ImmA/IrrE family metallo-endopeptidase [Actinomadura sp. WAC 06369]|uniref:ImmA/IrrE family metallo-endopeptidase n=1 Tax=Actinomadura sp. WAC 06369 TaxID=2203193 RepID=UPI003FA35D82